MPKLRGIVKAEHFEIARHSEMLRPFDPAVPADYWIGFIADPEEEAIEEHLFESDYCGHPLRQLIALADRLCKLSLEKSLRLTVSDALLQRAADSGLAARDDRIPSGGHVECIVSG